MESEQIPNGRRTDPERTPNGPRTDPERTRTDPERILNGSQTDPERIPNGARELVILGASIPETALSVLGSSLAHLGFKWIDFDSHFCQQRPKEQNSKLSV